MRAIERLRIDKLLVERGLVKSRERAKALIMAAKVLVDGRVVDKAGTEVGLDAEITLKEDLPYVSRGGLKLEGFLKEFEIDVTGLVAMDVGSSTGGFTDCLLQKGAVRVYCIDVGKGLLDWSLRSDERVTVMEGVNIRYLDPTDLGSEIDLAVIDVAFISLTKVLPKVVECIKEGGRVVALIKPQFEVGKGEVGKGGIVKDPAKHRAVVESIKEFSTALGLKIIGLAESSITGTKGNREFGIYLTKDMETLEK